MEAADVAVPSDEEELPQRLSHADAHKLRLAGALPRQRGQQPRPTVQAEGEDRVKLLPF